MGLMDRVRAHARIHENVDRDAESTGTTNERSTNWYESVSAEESNSYQFVLRKGMTPSLPESQYKQNGVREDEAGADAQADGERSERSEISADAAVATLRYWYSVGALDTLPERIPGFAGELVQYSDRARLIGLVKAILDSVPWSLTAQERAVQFVAVLTPLIECVAP